MGFSNENKKRSVWKNKKLVRKKRKRRNKKPIHFNTLPNGNPSKYQPQPYNLNPIWTGSNRNRSYTKLPENQNFENFIESNLKFSNFWNDFYILLYKNLSICKFVKKNYKIDISRPVTQNPWTVGLYLDHWPGPPFKLNELVPYDVYIRNDFEMIFWRLVHAPMRRFDFLYQQFRNQKFRLFDPLKISPCRWKNPFHNKLFLRLKLRGWN